MSCPPRTRRLVWHKTIVPVSLLLLSSAGSATSADWQVRVTPRLFALWQEQQSEASDKRQAREAALPAARTALAAARFDSQGRVQLDVRYDCAAAAPTKALVSAGLLLGTTVHEPPLCSVEGWLQSSDLPTLAAASAVRSIDLPTYSRIIKPIMRALAQPQAMASTAIDGNAVSIMHADQYIQTTATNGSGVTIGVMSNDVTNLAIIQSRGELPAQISNLTPHSRVPIRLRPTKAPCCSRRCTRGPGCAPHVLRTADRHRIRKLPARADCRRSEHRGG